MGKKDSLIHCDLVLSLSRYHEDMVVDNHFQLDSSDLQDRDVVLGWLKHQSRNSQKNNYQQARST
jgi:hypothetical protein